MVVFNIKEIDSEKGFDHINNILMAVMLFVCLYPIWYVLILSISNDRLVSSREIWFLPRALTLNSYFAVFYNNLLMRSFWVTIKRTLIGAFFHSLLNAMMAYGLSKKYFIARKTILVFVLVTMYFSGGLIPWYLQMRNIGLLNNFWGLVLPSLYGGWTIIIFKTFFQGLPESLEESAKLDGANDLLIFFRIILPLSTPVLATMFMFSAVGHWNDWFMGDILFTSNRNIPMQTLLMKIIFQTQAHELSRGIMAQGALVFKQAPSSESIKMAAIIISTIPIVIVYPFLQKYFVKGIMIGSIKG